MTYENMYNVLKYMKENNLKITKEILEELKSINHLYFQEMPILSLSVNYIKIYFKKRTPELFTFLMDASKKNLDFAKVTAYSHLLMSPDSDYRKLILRALQNEAIFNSDFAMAKIAQEKSIRKLESLIKACEIPEIRNDVNLLGIISNANFYDSMDALTAAFKHEEIRNSEIAIAYLIKQPHAGNILTVTNALLNPQIKAKPQVLDLIANIQNIAFQKILYEACLNPSILEDFAFITFLTEMPARNDKAKIFIEAYTKLNKKEYTEFMNFYKANLYCHVDKLISKYNSLIAKRGLAIYQEKLDFYLNEGNISQFMTAYQEIDRKPILKRVKHLEIPTDNY